jgi:OOP family OmpA-OmpF porin
MKRAVLVLVIALMVVGTAGYAMAENRAGSFNITPFVGWYMYEGDQPLDDAFSAGLALGYNFTERWGIEAAGSWIWTDSTRPNVGDTESYYYRLDALYHFNPEGKFVPYVVAGVGAINIDPYHGDNDTDTFVDYGAGIKYFFHPNVAFRADMRGVYAFGDPEHNATATVGLTFQLGGKKEEAPPCVDDDMDGVCDDVDKCPGTPSGLTVDDTGCAQIKEQVSIRLLVEFDFDKAKVKEMYHDDLKEIAEFMKTYPRTKAVLEGHTDAIGTEAYNQKLSERRAKSVRQYLVDNFGISPDRIESVGYGESQPIADNKTDEGRQRNRRVVGVMDAVQIDVK